MNTKTKRLVEYYGTLENLVAAYDGYYSLYDCGQSMQQDMSKFWPDFSDGTVGGSVATGKDNSSDFSISVRDVYGIKIYEEKNGTDCWEI